MIPEWLFIRTVLIILNTRIFLNRLFLAIALTTGISRVGAQNNIISRDTFDIYKNKSGIDFDVYLRHWFRRSHRFEPAKLNRQDSAVMINGKNRYFRVYDAHDRLWFEGATDESEEMIGDVKWFRENGNVERIVRYGAFVPFTCCPDSMCRIFEGPEPCKWTLYRKNGALKKERTFLAQGDCEGADLKCYSRTIRYNRKGEVRSKHTRRITFRRMFSGA